MNIKRAIARAAIGGQEPKVFQELAERAQALRQDDRVRERWNQAAENVARENRRWMIPAMCLTASLAAVGAYNVQGLVDPLVSAIAIVGVHAFMWRSFCVAERR